MKLVQIKTEDEAALAGVEVKIESIKRDVHESISRVILTDSKGKRLHLVKSGWDIELYLEDDTQY